MPAVIAAASGLFGTAIGIGGTLFVQLRVERQRQEYDRQKETRRRKEDKLVELVSALPEHEHWITSVRHIRACPQLRRMIAETSWTAARKFRASLS